jgi:Lrp/AsnC family transcriptional regulator for asnA, asnC and gidA
MNQKADQVPRPIDRVDAEIIKLLQKDGRIPNTEIARLVGVSEATVRGRLNRLIEDGVIQIVAVSNPLMLGFNMVGSIRIFVEVKKMDAIIEALKKLKPLWHIVQSTGDASIDTEFIVKSQTDLNELIFERINRIDGVLRTETSLFLKYVKRQYDWGTGLDE